MYKKILTHLLKAHVEVEICLECDFDKVSRRSEVGIFNKPQSVISNKWQFP